MPQVGEIAPPLLAQPVFGLPVDLGALSAKQPVVLLFVRHLGSPAARAALALAQDRMPEFDRAGISLIAVTPSSLTLARDFVPRFHLLFPLVCDPDGSISRTWGVGEPQGRLGIYKALLGFWAMPQFLGYGQGPVDGPITYIPASFVVQVGGRLALSAPGRSVASQPDLSGLLEAACSR